MIKNIFLFSAVLLMAVLWTKTMYAQFGGLNISYSDAPVVVELYTSQSCSSCPPADKILQQISEQDNIIALGCHVTYWDHLHWKDTLSQEFCTSRQRNFAAFNNSRRVYTPQMVVNGRAEFVGSRSGQASAEIAQAQRQNSVAPIEITQSSGDIFELSLPSVKQGSYTIWIFGTRSEHEQSIPSGENKGATVQYVQAAMSQNQIDNWNGSSQTKNITIDKDAQEDSLVVLAQRGGYGEIVAAGKISLK